MALLISTYVVTFPPPHFHNINDQQFALLALLQPSRHVAVDVNNSSTTVTMINATARVLYF
eukprot:14048815-Ditylum_brightwellii.AAC.1